MPEPMTPEREAKIREHIAYAEAGDFTLGDIYARDLLAELDAARERMRRVRAELLAAEARMLDARAFVNPRAKSHLDAAARRLRKLATALGGTGGGS